MEMCIQEPSNKRTESRESHQHNSNAGTFDAGHARQAATEQFSRDASNFRLVPALRHDVLPVAKAIVAARVDRRQPEIAPI